MKDTHLNNPIIVTTPVSDRVSLRVLSIQPFRWTEKELRMQREDLAVQEKCGVNHVAFSCPMEPENAEKPFEKAEKLVAQFKKTRAKLKGNQKIGFLIQSLLGHGRRMEPLKGYSEIITIDGENNHRFCPLNKNFQKYIAQAIRKLCETKPDFLLVDDDFRMVLSGIGCFCPDHLKKFEKLTGKKYTREALRKILNRTDPESKATGDNYMGMSMETLWNIASIIREEIDSVDPSIECGFCTSSEGEFVYAAQTARILAGKTKPFVRLNNGFYIEDGNLSFPYRQMNTAIEQHYISTRGGVETISECDTYPHNRYSLSLTGMHMHICSSMLTGCSGRKMWIENFRCHDPKIPALYTGLMKKRWKEYEALNGIRKEFPWSGAVVPLPEKPPTVFNPVIKSKMIRIANFIADCFGVLGIAASYEDDGHSIVLLTGDLADFFSDDELHALLKRNVVLDASAVRALLKRGFGKLIGIRKAGPVPGGVEEKIVDPELLKAGSPEILGFSFVGSTRLFPVKNARVLSWLSRRKFMGGCWRDSENISPATVLYRNETGGQVISLSISMTREVWTRNINLHHVDRKYFFQALLKLLDPSHAPAWVETDLSCYLMYGLCARTGMKFHAAVFNLSLDPMTEVKLHVGRGVKKVTVLRGNGKYIPVKFQKEEDAVTIENSENENPLILLGEFW